MTTLDNGFEDGLKQSLLDDVERKASGIAGMMRLIAETNWQAYADRNGYDIDHIWRDAEVEFDRTPDAIEISGEWPFSAQFEHGVEPHTIEATNADFLKFPWPNAPEEVKEQFRPQWENPNSFLEEPIVLFKKVNWGSETGGIPAARAVRDMLRELRGELR